MFQRKDGTYQEAITVDETGKKRRVYFYGKTKAEVMHKIASYQQGKTKGRLFSAVADEWDTAHQESVSYNGHAMYHVPYRMAVERFGSLNIGDITPPEIAQYIKQIAAKGYAARTVKAHLSLLNMIFEHGIIAGDITANPAESISIPRGLRTTPRGLPDSADIPKIINGLSLPFGLFAFLLLYTGLRRGEALALRYDDIDRAAGLITVDKAIYFDVNQPVLKETKTKAGTRLVPLLNPLADALPAKNKGLIFSSSNGGPLSQTIFRRRWANYAKASGITATPHQLRHLYATMLFEAGIEDKTAQELMGHSSIVTTRNIYTHLRNKKLEAASNALNQYIVKDL